MGESLTERKAAPCVVCLGFFDGVHLAHQALLRAARAAKKHKALYALTAALTEELLPEAETVDDEDYRQIISLLLEARRAQESDTVRRFADMTDYYTLWAHQIKTPIASMRL